MGPFRNSTSGADTTSEVIVTWPMTMVWGTKVSVFYYAGADGSANGQIGVRNIGFDIC